MQQADPDLRRRITAVVRMVKPHIVFTHYPYPNLAAQPTCNGDCPAPASWDDMGFHPDHQRVGWHAMNALYGGGSAAGNDLVFDDLAFAGLLKWTIEELYFFAMPSTSGVAPITHYQVLDENLYEAKLQAILAHRSQFLDNRTMAEVMLHFWLNQTADAVGVTGMAEGFVGYF